MPQTDCLFDNIYSVGVMLNCFWKFSNKIALRTESTSSLIEALLLWIAACLWRLEVLQKIHINKMKQYVKIMIHTESTTKIHHHNFVESFKIPYKINLNNLKPITMVFTTNP